MISLTCQSLNNPLEQLVYGETGNGMKMVMINGNIVMEQVRLKTIDGEVVLKERVLTAKRDIWLERTKIQGQFIEKMHKKYWPVRH
ncbi:MAG: hypothetical protein GX039_02715 [Clostridia bacterium]|nr:hypothetical protein [Clostridia bacterium]